MRYLITGGTGTIGRAVVSALWDDFSEALRTHEEKGLVKPRPPDIRILSRDDSKQASMADEWRTRLPGMRFLIGEDRKSVV